MGAALLPQFNENGPAWTNVGRIQKTKQLEGIVVVA